jgi:predicted aspartyl protease
LAVSKHIVSSRFPYLPLRVHLKLNRNQEIDTDTEALVDTGFSGDVALPSSWVTNGHRPDGYVTWMMADGSSTMAAIYLGSVRLVGLEEDVPISIPCTITVLGDEVIAGRGLTDRFRLTLDHGKKLIVEP